MTNLNKYNPYPESIAIRCPKCGEPAEFRFPFTFVGKHGPKPPPAWPSTDVTTWGNWTVIQHDPALYPWKQPPEGHSRAHAGIRACPRCAGRFAHTLSWPSDAYYSCEIRGQALWAWSRDHVVALVDFLASAERDPSKYPNYFLYLRHIPSHFTAAKHRELAVRKLKQLL